MDYKEHHELNKEFLERFPIEKLRDMTLECHRVTGTV